MESNVSRHSAHGGEGGAPFKEGRRSVIEGKQTDERTFEREMETYQKMVSKVRSFLDRILSTQEHQQPLGKWEEPVLIQLMQPSGSISVTDEVNINLDNNSIEVNRELLKQDPEKLRVNIAMATATYYLHKMLGESGMPEAIKKGKEREGLPESIIATHALARLTAIAFRRDATMGSYGDTHGFARELFWYKDTDRELARMLHATFAEIQTGEFHFKVLSLIAPEYKGADIIRLGRQVALLEYLKHEGDVEAAIRGLFRSGQNAMKGIAKTGTDAMHASIDTMLKKPEEGRVIRILPGGSQGQTVVVLRVAMSDGLVDANISRAIVDEYTRIRSGRENDRARRKNEAWEEAQRRARAGTPEGEDARELAREYFEPFMVGEEAKARDSVATLTSNVYGREEQMDAIATDMHSLFDALEPADEPDIVEKVRPALVAFGIYGLEAALPAGELADLSGGHSLMAYAQLMLSHNLIEEVVVLDAQSKEKVTHYRLTAKGAELARIERAKSARRGTDLKSSA